MCGVVAKRRTSDLSVTGSCPSLATRHIRYVLFVNSPKKLNILSWLLIYLCKESVLHQTFFYKLSLVIMNNIAFTVHTDRII